MGKRSNVRGPIRAFRARAETTGALAMSDTNRRAPRMATATLFVASLVSASLDSPTTAAAGNARTAADTHPAKVQNARSDVSSNRSANSNTNVNRNADVNTNVNRDTNVNVNRNVNVGGGGYDRWGHPIATAAAVTATAVAVGTVAATLPSSGCSMVSVGGVSYQRCGPNYYQPVYQGGGVQYVVVTPPQ